MNPVTSQRMAGVWVGLETEHSRSAAHAHFRAQAWKSAAARRFRVLSTWQIPSLCDLLVGTSRANVRARVSVRARSVARFHANMAELAGAAAAEHRNALMRAWGAKRGVS